MSVWIRAALGAGLAFAAATGALVGTEQVIGGADEATVETVSAPVTATGDQPAAEPEADLPPPPAQPAPDPEAVRAELRAFARAPSQYPGVDAFVTACTTPQTRDEMVVDEVFVISARYEPEASYSSMIRTGPSGQSLFAVRDPMFYVDMARLGDPSFGAEINRVAVPLSWASLEVEDRAISPLFFWDAIALRYWRIDPSGARQHSVPVDLYDSYSIPCADPQAGVAALEDIRDAAQRDANATPADQNEPELDSRSDAQGQAPGDGPSRYDRFIAPLENDPADAANAACGLSKSLTDGGDRLRFSSDQRRSLIILSARGDRNGGDGVLRSYRASTEGMHAFEEGGDLVVQADYAGGGFTGRLWHLDANGSPALNEPLTTRARITVSCDDPAAAADWLNADFYRFSRTHQDPARSGAWALTFQPEVFARSQPNIDAFVSACTPDPVRAAMPAGQRVMLHAVFDADAVYGEEMIRSNSSERIAGNAQPMIYITVAELDEATSTATVERLRVPVDWHDLQGFSQDRLTLEYRWQSVEAHQWTIAPDGSRSSLARQGTLAEASIPCADPQAGAAALRAFAQSAL